MKTPEAKTQTTPTHVPLYTPHSDSILFVRLDNLTVEQFEYISSTFPCLGTKEACVIPYDVYMSTEFSLDRISGANVHILV